MNEKKNIEKELISIPKRGLQLVSRLHHQHPQLPVHDVRHTKNTLLVFACDLNIALLFIVFFYFIFLPICAVVSTFGVSFSIFVSVVVSRTRK